MLLRRKHLDDGRDGTLLDGGRSLETGDSQTGTLRTNMKRTRRRRHLEEARA